MSEGLIPITGGGPRRPVTSNFLAPECCARRPRFEMLVNRVLREAGLNRIRPCTEALRDFLKCGEPVQAVRPTVGGQA